MLTDTLKNQLHQIGQQAEEQRVSIRKNRYVPDAIIQKLKQSGACKLWVAQAYGGLQGHVQDLMEAVQILSYYNGSLGWILGVTGTAALSSGYLPPQSAQEIFGSPNALTGGWAAPVGRAEKVEGGLLVNGKWSWGSGIRYCTHIVGGVLISDPKTGRKSSAIAYFNPQDVQLMDNWHVLGLHGTNSIDYSVSELFVPDGKWLYFPVQQAHLTDSLYRFSFLGALASGVASVGLGLAQRAIDEIIQLSQQKVPNGARKTLAERPVVHEKIALLQAHYHASKSFLEQAVNKNWEEAEQGSIQAATKSLLRLACAYAVRQSAEIVQQAYTLGGGSSIWDDVKLQELLQDIHVVTQHAMASPNNFEIAGRITFNQKVNEWLL